MGCRCCGVWGGPCRERDLSPPQSCTHGQQASRTSMACESVSTWPSATRGTWCLAGGETFIMIRPSTNDKTRVQKWYLPQLDSNQARQALNKSGTPLCDQVDIDRCSDKYSVGELVAQLL